MKQPHITVVGQLWILGMCTIYVLQWHIFDRVIATTKEFSFNLCD